MRSIGKKTGMAQRFVIFVLMGYGRGGPAVSAPFSEICVLRIVWTAMGPVLGDSVARDREKDA